MSSESRRVWTQEEDEHMIALEGELKGDWTAIARQMQRCFPRISRTAKQCKERWTNHLDPSISRLEWAREEVDRFVDLWLHCGNRWTRLAASMQGRSENSLKNFFYSNLRRAFKIMQEEASLSGDRARKVNRLSVDWICELAQAEKNNLQLLKEFVSEALWLGLEKKNNADSPMHEQIRAVILLYEQFDKSCKKTKSKTRVTIQTVSLLQLNQVQNDNSCGPFFSEIQNFQPDPILKLQEPLIEPFQDLESQFPEGLPVKSTVTKEIRRVQSIEIHRPNSPSVSSFYGETDQSLMNVSDTPSFLRVINSHLLIGNAIAADAVLESFWMMS